MINNPQTYIHETNYQSIALAYFSSVINQQSLVTLDEWSHMILEKTANYFNAIQGTFYINNSKKKHLEFLAGYAVSEGDIQPKSTLKLGEDTVGQAVQSKKCIIRKAKEDSLFVFKTGTTQINAKAIITLPLCTDNINICGIIELIFYQVPSDKEIDFLKSLRHHIGSNLKIRLQEEELTRRNKELQQKNNMITSSIKYAQNIQEAILPRHEDMKKIFSDYFIIYQPKDIVSGDFYWMSQAIKEQQSSKVILSCIDCTGHGVPGAFMSMIGNTLLQELINEKQIYAPSQIIYNLHKGIQTALHQEENNNKDGMDLILCTLDYEDNQYVNITFAGAKRNLIIIKDDQLIELKGDRISIGGNQNVKEMTFSDQKITLKKGDLIFLTTDGYEDSPNHQRKKFGYNRLKNMLSLNSKLDLTSQKYKLMSQLDEHLNGSLQRDDITIMGLRL